MWRNLEYRGFIAGILAVLGLYALLSCLPAVRALLLPAPTPAARPASTGAAPGPLGQRQARPRPALPAAPPVQSLQLSSAPEDSRSDSQWQRAAADLVLLDKPGGVGLIPPSLCRAALTIHHGAHVRVLGEEGGWVKVQSASRAVGWVKAAEMRAD